MGDSATSNANNQGQGHGGSREGNADDEWKLAKKEKRKRYAERKKLKKAAGLWNQAKNSTCVYVSGLPLDVTVEELYEHFKVWGMIAKKGTTDSEYKIKLYEKPIDNTEELILGANKVELTGDALIQYVHKEAVEKAIEMLHEKVIRVGDTKTGQSNNAKLSVQRWEFEQQDSLNKEEYTIDELKDLAAQNKTQNEVDAKRRKEMWKRKKQAEREWVLEDDERAVLKFK